jgi:hypothetical protein
VLPWLSWDIGYRQWICHPQESRLNYICAIVWDHPWLWRIVRTHFWDTYSLSWRARSVSVSGSKRQGETGCQVPIAKSLLRPETSKRRRNYGSYCWLPEMSGKMSTLGYVGKWGTSSASPLPFLSRASCLWGGH